MKKLNAFIQRRSMSNMTNMGELKMGTKEAMSNEPNMKSLKRKKRRRLLE